MSEPAPPMAASADPIALAPAEPTTQGRGGADPDQPAEHAAPELVSAPLRQRLEAILVVVDQPTTTESLAAVLGVPAGEVFDVLSSLRAEYLEQARGFELRDVAGGWRLYSATACAPDVERFVLDGTQARITHAALETLAVVAYRQPVSRQSIASIRGVGVDGVVRSLLAKGLIAESGSGAAGATLYVTTHFFLSRLGLSSLDDLPSLAPYLPHDLDDFQDEY